ncbi:heme NO-binding domain-containing protein [Chitinibacter tainanensis]|uniref:heme NO-binding domain-containing protein n=1 Tax=Chitinibacter tainanensis TaxID=230667 RepID=UPI00235536BD|nr:heme NO-binding domain-containing protein [Chitinibacter tainanensis]
MYGLVNRAVEQLVEQHLGPTGWARVCKQAGIADDGFVAISAYPDQMTYKLVGAVSQEMGMSPEQVLEAFGEYWIMYTAEEGYADLLQTAGTSLREFLGNLDQMHSRIETVFAQMVAPVFSVEDEGPGRYVLLYQSQREGLAPMVVGLVKGLAKRFGQPIEIEQLPSRAGFAGVFRIQEA